jgi:hypothetical protein
MGRRRKGQGWERFQKAMRAILDILYIIRWRR